MPTVPEVLPLVSRLYERHPVGCCLHIVLDDCNVSDGNVEHCIHQAIRDGHPECEALARTLLEMSRTQRLRLAHGH